MGTSGNG